MLLCRAKTPILRCATGLPTCRRPDEHHTANRQRFKHDHFQHPSPNASAAGFCNQERLTKLSPVAGFVKIRTSPELSQVQRRLLLETLKLGSGNDRNFQTRGFQFTPHQQKISRQTQRVPAYALDRFDHSQFAILIRTCFQQK